ncbi:MAG: hypothetical protein QXU98_03455 [Candidatus Parvarchaeota archaeon]
MVPDRVKFDTAFAYNGRSIQFFKRSSRIGYIYIFQDPIMMAEEESSILIDVDSSEKDMKYFEEKKRCLDVFAVVSDLDQNPFNIYEQYKLRKEVERVFGTM